MKNDNINNLNFKTNENFYSILPFKKVSDLRKVDGFSNNSIDGSCGNKINGCFVAPKVMR